MALTIEELLARDTPTSPAETPVPREGDLTIDEVQAREAPDLPTLDPEGRGQFAKGFDMGRQGLQQGFGGFVTLMGETMGSQDLREAGFRISADAESDMASTVAPRVHQLEQIEDFDDFADWVAQGVGQLVPSVATMIGTGGIAGVVGKQVVKQGIKNTIRANMAREMSGKASKAQVRKAINEALRDPKSIERLRSAAKTTGLTGASFASGSPQAGDIFTELTQEAGVDPDDAVGTALLGGAVGGALDTVLLGRVVGKFFPGVDRQFAKGYIKEFAKEAGIQSMLEGGTEAAQEAIALAARSYHDPTFDVASDEAKSKLLNAFALGALGGALSGGPTGVTSKFLTESGEARRAVADKIAQRLRGASEDTTNSDTLSEEMEQEVDDRDLADSVIPSAAEFKDRAMAIVTNASKGAKRRAVNIMRQAGMFDNSVGAAMVPLSTRALNDMDMVFHERIAPRVKEMIDQVKAEITEIKNNVNDPAEVQQRVEELRTFFDDALQQLMWEEIPPTQRLAEDRAAARLSDLLEQTQEAFENTEALDSQLFEEVQQEQEGVEVTEEDLQPDTVMSAALEEAGIQSDDFVDDTDTTPVDVNEEELAAGNSRRLQEERRGVLETFLGRRAKRQKTVVKKDGSTKTFETERRSRREIRADEETARPRTVQDDLVAFETEEEAQAEVETLQRLYDVAAMLVTGDNAAVNEQVEFEVVPEEGAGFSIKRTETGLIDRSGMVWDAAAGESVPAVQYMADGLERAQEDARGNPQDQIEIDGVKYRLATLAETEMAVLRAEEGDSVNAVRAAQNMITKMMALGAGETINLNTRIVWSGERRTVGEVMGFVETRSELAARKKREKRSQERKAKQKNVRKGAKKETRANPPAADQTNDSYNAQLETLQEELERSQAQRLTAKQKADMRKRGATAREIQEAEENRIRPGQNIERAPAEIEAEIADLTRKLENHEHNRQAREELDPFIQGDGDPVAGAIPRVHGSDGRIYGPDDGDPPTFATLAEAQDAALRAAAAGAKNSYFEVAEVTDGDGPVIRVVDQRPETDVLQDTTLTIEEEGQFQIRERELEEGETSLAGPKYLRNASIGWQVGEGKPTGEYLLIETPYPSRSHASPVFDTESFETGNIDDPSNAGAGKHYDEEADQNEASTLTLRTGQTTDQRKGPSAPVTGTREVPITEGGSAPTPNAKQAILDEKHREGSLYGDEEFEQIMDVNDKTGTVVVERGGRIGQQGNVRVMFHKARTEGAQNIARLIADLANRLGIRNGINVVDRAGMDKIIKKALKNKARNAELVRQLQVIRDKASTKRELWATHKEAFREWKKAQELPAENQQRRGYSQEQLFDQYLKENGITYGKAAASVFYNSQIILFVNDTFAIQGAPKGAAQMAGFMHEMGHVVFQVYMNRMSVEAKAALWNDFVAMHPEYDVHSDPKNYRRALEENAEIRERFRQWRETNGFSMTNKPAVLTRQFRRWLREEGYQTESITFEEWAANQFVGWVNEQVGNPRARSSGDPNVDQAVRGFYRRMKLKMTAMWNWFKEKFGVTETFSEFMQGIVEAHKGNYDYNIFSKSFKHDGNKGGDYMGYQWFGELPAVRNYTDPAKPDSARLRHDQAYSGMLRRLEAMGRAYRALELRPIMQQSWQAYKESLFALNTRVRGMAKKYPALDELAAVMRPRPGEGGISFNILKLASVRQFELEVDEIIDRFTEEELQQAREELRGGKPPTTEAGRVMQEYIRKFARYLKGAGLPIREVENYFPEVLDRAALLEPGAAETLIERYARIVDVTQEEARRAVGRIIANSDESSRAAMAQESVDGAAAALDVANPYAGNFRERKLTREQYAELFDGFIENDISTIWRQYISQMVRMAEYNRLLGERSTDPKEWNPNAHLEEIIAEAREQGMTQEEVAEIEDIIDTWLGRRGIAMHPRSRQIASWLMTFQNMRVLLFTVFASLPDLFTSVVRTGSVRTAARGWRDYVAQESLSRADLHTMGRTWGIIADHLNQSAVADHYTANFMTESAQQMNDKFFKATGLLMFTNFTRKLALSVGNQYLSEHAIEAGRGNEESQAKLAELGLTWDTVDENGNTIKGDVTRWIESNRVVYGSMGYTFEDNPNLDKESEEYLNLEAAFKVRNAMFRFTDESVMRPDASMRPGWASDPRWMLVWHLKSFMYAFMETTLLRVGAQMKSNQGFYKALPLLHLSLILPATALGLELRELIQYMGSGSWGTPNREPRTDRMNGFEYITELVSRSGALGPAQLALDLEAADDRNQFPLLGVVGPTAASAKQLIFDPASQSVPKHIPVVSQLPWARDLVRQGVFE